jgi:hypothetical protein
MHSGEADINLGIIDLITTATSIVANETLEEMNGSKIMLLTLLLHGLNKAIGSNCNFKLAITTLSRIIIPTEMQMIILLEEHNGSQIMLPTLLLDGLIKAIDSRWNIKLAITMWMHFH